MRAAVNSGHLIFHYESFFCGTHLKAAGDINPCLACRVR